MKQNRKLVHRCSFRFLGTPSELEISSGLLVRREQLSQVIPGFKPAGVLDPGLQRVTLVFSSLKSPNDHYPFPLGSKRELFYSCLREWVGVPSQGCCGLKRDSGGLATESCSARS